MNMNARQAFEKVRDFMDETVDGLSRAGYIEFIDMMGGEIQARQDCINEEEAE